MSHHGTELAIDELNARGGVLGKKLELLTEDNQSKQGESKTCAQKLISRDNVVALLGEVASGRSLEAAPICQRYKIPMISPSSTDPKVTETGNYIFRVCFIDSFQGLVMARFALNSLKLHNVALLTDVASAYSVGLADFFKQAFTAAGGNIAVEQNYNSGGKDFKAQLTAIKASGAAAIFVPGYYNEAGLICRQARNWPSPPPSSGATAGNPPSWSTSAEKRWKAPISQPTFLPSKSQRRRGIYQRIRGPLSRGADAMAALGYDSAMLLADALKRAGTTDGMALRDALATTAIFRVSREALPLIRTATPASPP